MVQAWGIGAILAARPALQTVGAEKGRAAPLEVEGPHQALPAVVVLAIVASQMEVQGVRLAMVATHQGALAAQEARAGRPVAAPTTILETVVGVEEAQATKEEEQVAQDAMEAPVEEALHGLIQM